MTANYLEYLWSDFIFQKVQIDVNFVRYYNEYSKFTRNNLNSYSDMHGYCIEITTRKFPHSPGALKKSNGLVRGSGTEVSFSLFVCLFQCIALENNNQKSVTGHSQ